MLAQYLEAYDARTKALANFCWDHISIDNLFQLPGVTYHVGLAVRLINVLRAGELHWLCVAAGRKIQFRVDDVDGGLSIRRRHRIAAAAAAGVHRRRVSAIGLAI